VVQVMTRTTCGWAFKRRLTRVVLPAPEGAEIRTSNGVDLRSAAAGGFALFAAGF
jgi:hypothetical protein